MAFQADEARINQAEILSLIGRMTIEIDQLRQAVIKLQTELKDQSVRAMKAQTEETTPFSKVNNSECESPESDVTRQDECL